MVTVPFGRENRGGGVNHVGSRDSQATRSLGWLLIGSGQSRDQFDVFLTLI